MCKESHEQTIWVKFKSRVILAAAAQHLELQYILTEADKDYLLTLNIWGDEETGKLG